MGHWNWIDNAPLRERQQTRRLRLFSAGLGMACIILSLVILPWLILAHPIKLEMGIGQVAGSLVGLILILVGQFRPQVFQGTLETWMTGAQWLGRINAKLLLGAVFIFIMIPLGLAATWIVIFRKRAVQNCLQVKKQVEPRSSEHMKDPF